MGGRAQLRRWRQGTWAVLALPTGAIVGLLAAESLLWPLAPDQGIYAWISDVIRDGGLPYADAWDIKGPSTFYTVALAQLVLGRHPWSIRVVDVVLLAITCGGLALLARRYAGPLAAVVSAGLFALWYLGSGFWDTGQPNAWATTLLVAAVVVATSSRLGLHARMAVAGLLLGACIGYKPLFALFLLVLVAAWATEERRPWTALLAGVASAAVVPLVIARRTCWVSATRSASCPCCRSCAGGRSSGSAPACSRCSTGGAGTSSSASAFSRRSPVC